MTANTLVRTGSDDMGLISVILALAATGLGYGAVHHPDAATVYWVGALVMTVAWLACVSSILAARGSSWFGLVPGGLLLTVSLVLIVATAGTAGNEPYTPMEHFFVALSVVAAIGAVVINVVNAGVFVGLSVTFVQIPLAFLLGFFFLFMPRGSR